MVLPIKRNYSYSYSIRPIYYIFRVFYLIPFTIVQDTNGNVVSSKVRLIDGVLFATFIMLHLNFLHYHYMKPIVQSSDIPHVLTYGDKILPILVHTHNIIIIIMNMYNRERIINIIKMFDTIDKEVNNFCFKFVRFDAKINFYVFF